jgi:hypothetical protein
MSQGGGSTQTTQTQSIPPWLQDAAQGYLGAAGQVAQLPFQPYTGQRVADLSPTQRNAIQGLGDLSGGTPYMDAAQNQLTQTLNGGFSNPYAQQGVGSGGQYNFSPVGGGGQYQFNPLSGGTNQYQGENPYLQSSIDRGEADITRNFNQAVAPEITRQMVLSGNLGGSANVNALNNAQHELGNQLTSFDNQQRQGAYNTSAQLAESGLNRNLQAGQFNANLGNQAFDSAAQRGLNAGQFNANLGNQAFDSAAQRGLNAGEFNANLGSQSYENERNRQMSGLGAASNLFGAQGQGYLNALQGGNTERNQYQNLLDSQYQDFTDWRNYPQQQLGIFGNALAPLFGGAPRSTTTDQGLPPPDRVSQGLGVAALGNFLGRGSGK